MPDMNRGWYDERIERYLDNDLPAGERRLFEAQLKLDASLAEELDLARRIANQLRKPDLVCPDRVEDAVMARVAAAGAPTRARRHSPFVPLALAASLLAAAGIGFQLGNRATTPSASELDRARTELAVALGVLDQVSQRTQRQVEQYWLRDGMVQPIRRGISRVQSEQEKA